MEQITCNMLFRWLVGLAMGAPVGDVAVFAKNRDRLLADHVAAKPCYAGHVVMGCGHCSRPATAWGRPRHA